jgi:hypothetical protein
MMMMMMMQLEETRSRGQVDSPRLGLPHPPSHSILEELYPMSMTFPSDLVTLAVV